MKGFSCRMFSQYLTGFAGKPRQLDVVVLVATQHATGVTRILGKQVAAGVSEIMNHTNILSSLYSVCIIIMQR